MINSGYREHIDMATYRNHVSLVHLLTEFELPHQEHLLKKADKNE